VLNGIPVEWLLPQRNNEPFSSGMMDIFTEENELFSRNNESFSSGIMNYFPEDN